MKKRIIAFAVAGLIAASANADVISNSQAIQRNEAKAVEMRKDIRSNARRSLMNESRLKEQQVILGRHNSKLFELGHAIQNHQKEARAGTAGAAAMANMPHVTQPGKTGISAGAAWHEDEYAVGAKFSGMSSDGKWVTSASFAVDSQSNPTFGAGILYQY